MKMLKVSDQTHAEITKIVGQLIAESGKINTCEDAIEALLHRSALLPSELLLEVERFLEENKQLGYVTKEEFLKDAARSLMEQMRRKGQVTPPQSAFTF